MGRIRRAPYVLLAPSSPIKGGNDPSGILSLSGNYPLSCSSNAIVTVERASNAEIRSANFLNRRFDTKNTIKFSFRLNRDNLKDFEKHARDLYLESGGNADWGWGPGSHYRQQRPDGSMRALLVSSRIHSDLDAFASLATLANTIAWGPQFNAASLLNSTTDDASLEIRFSTEMDSVRDLANHSNLRELCIGSVFEKLSQMFLGKQKKQFCQLSRGIGYIVNGLHAKKSPEQQVVWFVSAIEALLGKRNERLSQEQQISRFRAITHPDNVDPLIGKFRSLYSFRNKLYHGSMNVMVRLGSHIILDEDDGTEPRFAFDTASDARCIALKIAQRYFELGVREVSFSTVIDR